MSNTEDVRFTANGTADIEDLTDSIHRLLNAVRGVGWGVFSSEYPTDNDPDNNPMPHVTYSLDRRVHTKDRNVKAQRFASVPDPEHRGENIQIYRTWFDCDLQFEIFADSNLDAMREAQRFEEFIEAYKGYFKEQGISEMVFKEERKSGVSNEYRQTFPKRTIVYTVRIERVQEIRSIDLKHVEGVVKVGSNEKEDVLFQSCPDGANPQDLGNSNFLDIYYDNFPNKKEE